MDLTTLPSLQVGRRKFSTAAAARQRLFSAYNCIAHQNSGARGGSRTHNLPITNRLRCRCATRADENSGNTRIYIQHKKRRP